MPLFGALRSIVRSRKSHFSSQRGQANIFSSPRSSEHQEHGCWC
jgi:hypothetical protein